MDERGIACGVFRFRLRGRVRESRIARASVPVEGRYALKPSTGPA
jgi:hypothetical protein